jgi:hypothetical protein
LLDVERLAGGNLTRRVDDAHAAGGLAPRKSVRDGSAELARAENGNRDHAPEVF